MIEKFWKARKGKSGGITSANKRLESQKNENSGKVLPFSELIKSCAQAEHALLHLSYNRISLLKPYVSALSVQVDPNLSRKQFEDLLQMESHNKKTLKKSRARRNKQIKNLRELVRRFFIQYLLAAAPSEEVFVSPVRHEERPWSPRPGPPPPSPIHGDPEPLHCYFPEEKECRDNSITNPSDELNLSSQSTKPGSELFRPTTPSYTPNSSLVSEPRFPGDEPRACSSPLSPPPFPFEPEEADSLGEDDSISLPGVDFPDRPPSPVPSIEILEEHPEPREVIDPLLELLRRACTPWTDPVPERAFSIGPDHFEPEEIRIQAARSDPDSHFFIYYPGVEFLFLAPMRLIDLVFPRSTARVVEIEEVTLD
ncbi:hypothetical protein PUN28_009839 [Cardiocondyla obscurior]|uniref:Uncharacterized protein n=1 Tax=Cardiocondyla obscurior TaxID=286306 RepID=A0AAW2FKW7_9HYME